MLGLLNLLMETCLGALVCAAGVLVFALVVAFLLFRLLLLLCCVCQPSSPLEELELVVTLSSLDMILESEEERGVVPSKVVSMSFGAR